MSIIKAPEQDLIVLAYIVRGFWETVRQYDTNMEPISDEGETGIMSDLIGFAALDDALFAEVVGQGEVTFVWCYEVSEPFGHHLAVYVHQNKEWPDPEHAKRMLRGLYDNATA